jgi:hypothetical protein
MSAAVMTNPGGCNLMAAPASPSVDEYLALSANFVSIIISRLSNKRQSRDLAVRSLADDDDDDDIIMY